MNWNEQLHTYFQGLECPKIPKEYGCMNPYKNQATMDVVKQFLDKYYADTNQRTVLFGINPGRFGSGITGISFTDPVRLKNVCSIDHDFDMRSELSSEFIYEIIEAYGGPSLFFGQFFISAVYPLGFLFEGKNINYYEFKNWKKHMLNPIKDELLKHTHWNINRDKAICIGRGDNYKVLKELSDELGLFKEVIPVPHPRWVMQYRRKRKLEFVDEFVKALQACN